MAPHDTNENWHWRGDQVGTGPAVIFDIDGVLADAARRPEPTPAGMPTPS